MARAIAVAVMSALTIGQHIDAFDGVQRVELGGDHGRRIARASANPICQVQSRSLAGRGRGSEQVSLGRCRKKLLGRCLHTLALNARATLSQITCVAIAITMAKSTNVVTNVAWTVSPRRAQRQMTVMRDENCQEMMKTTSGRGVHDRNTLDDPQGCLAPRAGTALGISDEERMSTARVSAPSRSETRRAIRSIARGSRPRKRSLLRRRASHCSSQRRRSIRQVRRSGQSALNGAEILAW
jgi:hypothetical protein